MGYVYETQHDVQIINVTYGNKTITDPEILKRLRYDLGERQNAFLVNNDALGGDPQPGVFKRCTVDYRDRPGEPHCRISAEENRFLNFAIRISRVEYGGVELNDKPDVIERLNDAIVNCSLAQQKIGNVLFKQDAGRCRIDNNNMGGDPRPGQVKKARVQFLSRSDFEFDWEEYDEGDMFPKLARAKYLNSFSIKPTDSVYRPSFLGNYSGPPK